MSFLPKLTQELQEVFRPIVIHSPGEMTIAGRLVAAPPAAQMPAQMAAPGAVQPAPLAGMLQMELYIHAYQRRPFGPAPAEPPASDADSAFLAELSAANAGRERWQDGWQVVFVEPASGLLTAQKQNAMQMFWPGQFSAAEGPQAAPRIGGMVNVLLAKEDLRSQPGYYIAMSETAPDQQDQLSFMRFYWNLRPEGAAPLVRSLTSAFNRFQVPFRFKTLARRADYSRADAAVLFVSRRYQQIALRLLPDVWSRLKPHLKPDTPLFTKPLAPGLGAAEDPANGSSFGLHRCGLTAQAIYDAWMQGSQTEPARLASLARCFEMQGLSPVTPHLRAGSTDCYAPLV
ncbi:MAG TPA: T3SS effector HopA1 family protein [Bryobacteraceae bacterium]|nr:T3SS effector HopA1 family protein [Bryobacteraceae bacterium]